MLEGQSVVDVVEGGGDHFPGAQTVAVGAEEVDGHVAEGRTAVAVEDLPGDQTVVDEVDGHLLGDQTVVEGVDGHLLGTQTAVVAVFVGAVAGEETVVAGEEDGQTFAVDRFFVIHEGVQIAAVAVEVGGVHFHHQIDATSAGEEGLLHFAVAWEADHVVAEEVVPAPENVAAEVVQLHCVEAWKGDHAVA